MGKLLNAFVGLAGLLVYIVGVVGQGAQGVVHLRQRSLGILFEPDAVRGAFAGVGALRMGRPACGGAGHAVLIGYQRVRFPGCARGDGEGHVCQALHAAVLRLGEGKVAADHLLAQGNRFPILDVLCRARSVKPHHNGGLVQQVARRGLNLFDHHAAQGQHDLALRVAVELVAFNQVLLVQLHVAVGIALQQPGALGRSQRSGNALRLLAVPCAKKAKDAAGGPCFGGVLVVVAQLVLRAFQGCGAHGVGRCRFGVLLLAGNGYKRALRRIGCFRGYGLARFDDCTGVLGKGIALGRLFLVDGVDPHGQKRALGGFAAGIGGKLRHARAFLVVHAEHAALKAVAVVAVADARVEGALANLQVAAEALLHHGLHIYRLVADEPQVVARAVGRGGIRRRDVHVVDNLAGLHIHFLQRCHVIGPYIGRRGGAGKRARTGARIAFQPAGEPGNAELGRVHAPRCADVAAPREALLYALGGVGGLHLRRVGNAELGIYAGRALNGRLEIEGVVGCGVDPAHEFPSFLGGGCRLAAVCLRERLPLRDAYGKVLRLAVVERNGHLVVGGDEGARYRDALGHRRGKPVELLAVFSVPGDLQALRLLLLYQRCQGLLAAGVGHEARVGLHGLP